MVVILSTLTQNRRIGDPAAKITFKLFTNNSDESAAFMSSVRVEAYQMASSREIAFVTSGDVNSTTTNKTGTKLRY